MNIKQLDLTVRDLVDGYKDNSKTDGGEVGYDSRLGRFCVNGNRKYGRIVIRRKRSQPKWLNL